MLRILLTVMSLALLSLPSLAETFEVKMLNRGEKGSMVFEPDYLKIQPGDKVIFKATHRSHNAASIKEMMPEGATPFVGKIDEEREISFDVPGFYGIKCTPHYAMDMVMMIKVGDATMPEAYREVKQPGVARKRFDEIFARIDAGE